MTLKTTIKGLRFDEVWQPRIGGKPGNRNAYKTGFYSADMRDLRRRIARWRQKVREALVQVASV